MVGKAPTPSRATHTEIVDALTSSSPIPDAVTVALTSVPPPAEAAPLGRAA